MLWPGGFPRAAGARRLCPPGEGRRSPRARTARPPPFFTLWARADGEGTPHATRSRSWFCFSVKGAQAGRALQFEVRTSNQEKLFRHDMRPVYRSLPSQPEWRPLRTAATFIVKPRRPGAPPISNPLLERETEEDRIQEEQRYGPRVAFAIQSRTADSGEIGTPSLSTPKSASRRTDSETSATTTTHRRSVRRFDAGGERGGEVTRGRPSLDFPRR